MMQLCTNSVLMTGKWYCHLKEFCVCFTIVLYCCA